MAELSYWSNALGRITRRRALATSGALALGTALLAACGGSNDGEKGASKKSSLITESVDTSKQAKRGGVLKGSRPEDILTWDPYLSGTSWPVFAGHTLSRLTRIKPGYMEESPGELVGDLAESWEFSPDRLQLTMKLRQGATWHLLPPVNGRAVDMQDILYSWDRFVKNGTSSSDFANSKNPGSPILSITSTDTRTLVIKLAYPMVTLPALLAVVNGGNFHLLPREGDSQYDPKKTLIGSGPFYVSEYVPSARFKLQRHTGYFEKDTPYVDSIEYPIIAEYAAGLAQFNAGTIYSYPVRPEGIFAAKAQSPDLLMYKTGVNAAGIGARFGWAPTDKAPFRDERLRQAYSLAIDRDLFIEVVYNVSAFEKEGIEVETRWNTSIPANFYEGWWLNPQSKDFGPNSFYFKHNVPEAKKLMAAAGFPDGFDMVSKPFQTDKSIEIVEGMVVDAGIRLTRNVIPLSEWQVSIRDKRGQFEGISYGSFAGGGTDAVENIATNFSKNSGATFTGLDVNGQGTGAGDPFIEEQLLKARSEIDADKRRTIVHELQRYIGKKQYLIRFPGGASGLELVWPVLKNWRVYLGDARVYHTNWLDESLPPVNKKA